MWFWNVCRIDTLPDGSHPFLGGMDSYRQSQFSYSNRKNDYSYFQSLLQRKSEFFHVVEQIDFLLQFDYEAQGVDVFLFSNLNELMILLIVSFCSEVNSSIIKMILILERNALSSKL
ncbi:hypothetical protein BK140_23085 [Paenibacillus macerans]|nr:hypothetical protein BK140_23085 [Paenibacillus macerans]